MRRALSRRGTGPRKTFLKTAAGGPSSRAVRYRTGEPSPAARRGTMAVGTSFALASGGARADDPLDVWLSRGGCRRGESTPARSRASRGTVLHAPAEPTAATTLASRSGAPDRDLLPERVRHSGGRGGGRGRAADRAMVRARGRLGDRFRGGRVRPARRDWAHPPMGGDAAPARSPPASVTMTAAKTATLRFVNIRVTSAKEVTNRA